MIILFILVHVPKIRQENVENLIQNDKTRKFILDFVDAIRKLSTDIPRLSKIDLTGF